MDYIVLKCEKSKEEMKEEINILQAKVRNLQNLLKEFEKNELHTLINKAEKNPIIQKYFCDKHPKHGNDKDKQITWTLSRSIREELNIPASDSPFLYISDYSNKWVVHIPSLVSVTSPEAFGLKNCIELGIDKIKDIRKKLEKEQEMYQNIQKVFEKILEEE